MKNYEKLYKEALERAKMINSGEDVDVEAGTTICEYIFPELQESEDEWIREKLIENFKWFCGDYPNTTKWGKDDDMLVKDIITWLEKQGKQDARYKYLEELLEADTIYQMAMNDAMVKEAKTKAIEAISNMDIFELLGLEKQSEQKSVDVDKMVNDYANSNERGNEEFGKPLLCMIRAYRQGLNDAIGKVALKSDWNEEDERIIKRIDSLLYAIHESEFEDIHAWLKSLKQRIGR